MLKKDIIAKLTELGIEHDSQSTAKALEALLPRSAESEVAPEPSNNFAHVYSANGGHIRTYDHVTHGKEFIDLANGFSAKIAGSRVVLQ